tara:strand:- start:18632 stop:19594 length:963 start_codon:yes stop_codon:yes gene_type:complete
MTFVELDRIRALQESGVFKTKDLTNIRYRDKDFPVVSFSLGEDNKSLPTLGIFAGVHGLEKIGTHVVLDFLESIAEQWRWNQAMKKFFQETRLISIPMINPTGVYYNQRSNYNHVDLMRNAPVEALDKTPGLVGGQTISSSLPWYRGNPEEMELENQAVVEFCEKELFPAQFAMSIDVHSGFGLRDRLWYPYAKTKENFPFHHESENFAKLFNKAHPHNIYKIEPQSQSYVTHGDLWDYLFDRHHSQYGDSKLYLPWCLEMGSWLWVKKNPRQLFSALGAFNPIKPHRYRRIMRRHKPLFRFMLESTHSYKVLKNEPIIA